MISATIKKNGSVFMSQKLIIKKVVVGQSLSSSKFLSGSAVTAIHCAPPEPKKNQLIASDRGKWKLDSNKKWKFQYIDKSYPTSQWEQIGPFWFYFDEQGYMLTGDFYDEKVRKWYYLTQISNDRYPEGSKVINEWVHSRDTGNWYYYDINGMLAVETMMIDGVRYFFDIHGVCKNPNTQMGKDDWIINPTRETIKEFDHQTLYYIGSCKEEWQVYNSDTVAIITRHRYETEYADAYIFDEKERIYYYQYHCDKADQQQDIGQSEIVQESYRFLEGKVKNISSYWMVQAERENDIDKNYKVILKNSNRDEIWIYLYTNGMVKSLYCFYNDVGLLSPEQELYFKQQLEVALEKYKQKQSFTSYQVMGLAYERIKEEVYACFEVLFDKEDKRHSKIFMIGPLLQK